MTVLVGEDRIVWCCVVMEVVKYGAAGHSGCLGLLGVLNITRPKYWTKLMTNYNS